jgi:hypothetical protein
MWGTKILIKSSSIASEELFSIDPKFKSQISSTFLKLAQKDFRRAFSNNFGKFWNFKSILTFPPKGQIFKAF